MTAPLSRSATSHASAETSPGGGGVLGAVTMSQLLSASPPTGFGGTGSGSGGSPAVGTSEESTAFGVDTLYGQLGGAGIGSRAWARPSAAGSTRAQRPRKPTATRHDAERMKLIVCAD